MASGTALVLAMSSTALLGLPGAPWGWHHFRYLLPFFPPTLVFAVVGFYSLRPSTRKTWLPEALASFAVLCSLLGLPVWAATTGGNSLQIKEQQVTIGYWLRENLPPGVHVGVNDAGAMRYYGGHPTVDLIGLTTNGLALSTRNGVGSLYETLEEYAGGEAPGLLRNLPDLVSGLRRFRGIGPGDSEVLPIQQTRGRRNRQRKCSSCVPGGLEVSRQRGGLRGEGKVRDTLDVAELAERE